MRRSRSAPAALLLVAGAACAAALALPRRAAADDFWRDFGDGKAELSGYALVEPRYGAARDGTAVLVFVTEDFSDGARVKADPGKHPASDVYPVLKLNFVRAFQTGIYDYHVLTSTFLRTEPAAPGGVPFAVVKSSFSAQEWCGHVYQQWLARGEKLVGTSHSYFDGEADQTPSLPLPPGGVMEDALPVLVRGLRGALLPAGGSRTVPFLPSSLRARFEHRPQAWGEAVLSRAAAPVAVKTALAPRPLAAFVVTVAERGGPTTTFTVEDAPPHRLLAWRSTSGESGEILGSARLPYWQLNQPGGEDQLRLLGLHPQAPPRPRR